MSYHPPPPPPPPPRAKLYNRKRYAEKIQMKKQIKMHEQKETKNKREDAVPKGAVPAYLLDR